MSAPKWKCANEPPAHERPKRPASAPKPKHANKPPANERKPGDEQEGDAQAERKQADPTQVISGKQIAVFRGHEDAAVWSAAYSPDGSRIVTASDDTTARIWNATS